MQGDRVAGRVPNGNSTGVLRFLINDQVSSTSLAVNLTSIGSAEMGEMRYHPFGTERFSSGTVSTRRQYTGQIHDLETGLYFYNARYYAPAIGHFVQADTKIPNPQDSRDFDRYAYVRNNPIKYSDPTGHFCFISIAAASTTGGTSLSACPVETTLVPGEVVAASAAVITVGMGMSFAWATLDPYLGEVHETASFENGGIGITGTMGDTTYIDTPANIEGLGGVTVLPTGIGQNSGKSEEVRIKKKPPQASSIPTRNTRRPTQQRPVTRNTPATDMDASNYESNFLNGPPPRDPVARFVWILAKLMEISDNMPKGP